MFSFSLFPSLYPYKSICLSLAIPLSLTSLNLRIRLHLCITLPSISFSSSPSFPICLSITPTIHLSLRFFAHLFSIPCNRLPLFIIISTSPTSLQPLPACPSNCPECEMNDNKELICTKCHTNYKLNTEICSS